MIFFAEIIVETFHLQVISNFTFSS